MILQALIFLGVAVFAAGDEMVPLEGTVNGLGINWGPYEMAKICSYNPKCPGTCQVDGGCCPEGHHYVISGGGQDRCCKFCAYGSECPTYRKYTCADTPCVPCICKKYDGRNFSECENRPCGSIDSGMCRECKSHGRWVPNHECTSKTTGNEVEVTVGPSHSSWKWVEVPNGITCPTWVTKDNYTFSVHVEDGFDGRKQVKVHRTDADQGWGINLKVKCTKGARAAIASA